MAKYPSDEEEFQKKVTELETKGINLSGVDQINRLTKNTAKYLNLNPYEVLQLPFGASDELLKKHFRKLSILVHPDKNRNDRERAKAAFEIVKCSNDILKTPEEVGKLRLIYDEGIAMFKKKLANKRKRVSNIIEDEDPYFELKRGTIAKLFADYELKRQEYMENEVIERKRYRDEEDFRLFTQELEIAYQKAWDNGRSQRVDSWRNFTQTTKVGKKNKLRTLKPPICKPEVRNKTHVNLKK